MRWAWWLKAKTTQPDGDIRRQLPMGDTHPSKEGGPAKADVPAEEVAKYATEELPGFGVIFRNKPGTADETYLRESILIPQAKLVAGYPPIMPTFKGIVTEDGLTQILAYIKALRVEQRAKAQP